MTRRTSKRFVAALTIAVVAASVAIPAADGASQVRRSFTLYAKPTRAQFISHADDRERGNFTNPFADVLPTPKNANSAKEGARAGDNAIFTLKLYTDTRLTHAVGTASYHCTVNFGQQAECEGQFRIGKGTMNAMGPADLKTGSLILPVIGGTGSYADAHGQLTSRSAGTKTSTQIIRFQLVA
jgi:hypothetical protein